MDRQIGTCSCCVIFQAKDLLGRQLTRGEVQLLYVLVAKYCEKLILSFGRHIVDVLVESNLRWLIYSPYTIRLFVWMIL